MQTEELTVYCHFLPALVNGDYSSFQLYDDPADEAFCKAVEKYIGNRIIDYGNVNENKFFGRPDYIEGCNHPRLPGDVVTITLTDIDGAINEINRRPMVLGGE